MNAEGQNVWQTKHQTKYVTAWSLEQPGQFNIDRDMLCSFYQTSHGTRPRAAVGRVMPREMSRAFLRPCICDTMGRHERLETDSCQPPWAAVVLHNGILDGRSRAASGDQEYCELCTCRSLLRNHVGELLYNTTITATKHDGRRISNLSVSPNGARSANDLHDRRQDMEIPQGPFNCTDDSLVNSA